MEDSMMGYYFSRAKTREELSEEQRVRYEALRAPDAELPQTLHDRIEWIKEYIGPLTSGEIISAYQELLQDAIVTWILADEDTDKIAWSEPKDIKTPPPSEAERAERQRRWEETVAQIMRDRIEREEELEPYRQEYERELRGKRIRLALIALMVLLLAGGALYLL